MFNCKKCHVISSVNVSKDNSSKSNHERQDLMSTVAIVTMVNCNIVLIMQNHTLNKIEFFHINESKYQSEEKY